MVTISVSVPAELKDRILSLDEVNWSAVARKAFQEKVDQIDLMKRFASKSKLTAKDADVLSKKMSRSMAKRFMEM